MVGLLTLTSCLKPARQHGSSSSETETLVQHAGTKLFSTRRTRNEEPKWTSFPKPRVQL